MSDMYPNYPLSDFPSEVDKFDRMQDITADDVFHMQQYQGYIQNNEIAKAQELLLKNPSLNSKIFNAEKFNKITDAIQTLQRFFRDNVQGFVMTWKEVLAEDIKAFDYQGEYIDTKQYKKNNFVTYKTSSGYHIFIALKDCVGVNPLNRECWKQLTITGANGEKGKDGVGFTFNGSWNEKDTYTANSAVQHKGKLYGALKDNTNVPPDTDDGTNWSLIYDFQTLAQIQKGTTSVNENNVTTVKIPDNLNYNSKTDDLVVVSKGKTLKEDTDYTLSADGKSIVSKTPINGASTPVEYEFKVVKNALLIDLIESFEVKDGSITSIKLEDTLMQKINYIDQLDAMIKNLQDEMLSPEEILKIKTSLNDNSSKIAQLSNIVEGLPSTNEFNTLDEAISLLNGTVSELQSGMNNVASVNSIKDLNTRVDSISRQLDSSDSSILTKVFYVVTTGSTPNAYEVNIPEIKGTVPEGLGISMKIHSSNSGSASLNVNGLGAKIIRNPDGTTVQANELKAGSVYTVRYNNVNFILQGRKEVIKEIEKLEPTDFGTARPADVPKTKTILTSSGIKEGTMEAYSNWTRTANENGIISVPKGYHDGNGKINIDINNLIPNNVKNGVNVGGIIGTYEGETASYDETTLPSPNQVLEGVSYGNGMTGSIKQRGARSAILTNQGESFNIPEGYHNGNGSVSVNVRNLTASNIRNGATVGGIKGNYRGDKKISRIDSGTFGCNWGYGTGGGTIYGATFDRPVNYSPDIVIIIPTPIPFFTTKDNFNFSGITLYWSNGKIDGHIWKPVGNSNDCPKIRMNNGTEYGMRFNEGFAPDDNKWGIVVYSWSSSGIQSLDNYRFTWIAMKK